MQRPVLTVDFLTRLLILSQCGQQNDPLVNSDVVIPGLEHALVVSAAHVSGVKDDGHYPIISELAEILPKPVSGSIIL